MEQATMFLERLEDWEFEKFLCMRTYLLEKLNSFRNQVEDEFLKEFIDEGPGLTNRNHRRWDNGDMWFSTTCPREQSRHLSPYNKEFDTLRRIGYSIWGHERLTSLGIRELFQY